ncbi:MAG: FecR family protein [Acidobacteriia bacterium]|nr:FecR family protein [Terriglobia bacterium]
MSRNRCALAVLTVLACALLALPALADSQARIVRLSDVQGSVQIDKNTGLGFESAFLNLPITQGVQIRTGDNGRAEIEFEDGSTMRLTPNTSVQFSTLGLDDSGKHISVINLVEGMAYVNWLGKDQFTLNFAREKAEIQQAAHFRVSTSTSASTFGVFKGDVDVESPSGKVAVGKKKMVTFAASGDQPYTLAKLEESPLDSWDKESIEYHQQYAKNNSSPYGYGASDLGYYGAYQNLPGYGMMWQPYFTGVGWDPFMDGAWSWYPGFGYMFVSAYPWGWMPYRYGNWMFVPGFGWMWQPGYWNTWNTVPRFTGSPTVRVHPLAAPSGTVSTVAVGRGGPVHTVTPPSRVIISGGSAGMGIARGSVSNLRHMNTEVVRGGTVSVRPAPQFSAGSGRSSGFGGSRSSGGSVSSGRGASAPSHTSAPSHSSGGSVRR